MLISYAIVQVSQMARSIAFYRDAIGLTLRSESPGWSEFDTGATSLALHLSAAPADSVPSPPVLLAGQCRPALRVPDLDGFRARTLAPSVECVEEPHTVFGKRVAQYRDPDGLVISIGEHVDD